MPFSHRLSSFSPQRTKHHSHLLAQHAGDAEHGPAAVDELGLAVPVFFFEEKGKFWSGMLEGGKKIKGEPFFGFRTLVGAAAADSIIHDALRSVPSAPSLRVLAAPFRASRPRWSVSDWERREENRVGKANRGAPLSIDESEREEKSTNSLPSERLGVGAEADGVEAAVSRQGAVEVSRGRDS